MKQISVLIVLALLSGCKEDYTVKPVGQVRLEYPEPKYLDFDSDCPFSFQYSDMSQKLEKKSPCWFVLHYPDLKANIYLTYFEISNQEDLASKIKDSEKIVQEQTVKATYIAPREFLFPEKKVYGTLFELGGDSAINLQFHATDSTQNLLTGSVYFSTPPKYDSLQPAINYLKKDVVHLIETLKWK
jgi:gliding motility-associated lipoprotein GldD